MPERQIRVIHAGDRLALDGFAVEVQATDHGWAPPTLGPGRVPPALCPPLRLRDYRMDTCFSFVIMAGGYRLLAMPGAPDEADLAFVVPTPRGRAYYESLLRDGRPAAVLPVHWDNIFRPLAAGLREFAVPGGWTLRRFRALVQTTAPGTRYVVPRPLGTYDVAALARRPA